MNLQLVQLIDKWVGVPTTILLSLWRVVFGGKNKESIHSPKKVLFVELSEMGSLILGYSAYEQAKQEFKNSIVYFLTFSSNREIIQLLGVVESANIVTINDDSLWSVLRTTFVALIKLRRSKIDTAIDMELFSRFSAILSFLSGAVNRVGFYQYTSEGLYRGSLLTREVLYNPHQHMTLNFLSLVYSLTSTEAKPYYKGNLREKVLSLPRLQVTPEDKELVLNIIRMGNPEFPSNAKYIVINADPGPVLPIRGWPLDRYASLVKKLLDSDSRIYVVLVGLKRSKSHNSYIMKAVQNRRCIDIAGDTSNLSELAKVIAYGSVLVTNDSGPAQLAGLIDIEQVVFFGPETPRLYSPVGMKTKILFADYSCSPCLSAFNHRRIFCKDNKCLQAISVDTTFSAVISALNKTSIVSDTRENRETVPTM